MGLLYCSAVWGSTFYLVKDALHGVHPVTLVAYRFLLSSFLLLPWVLRGRNIGRCMKEGAVLSALLLILYLAQTVGLGWTSASHSGFITGLFVLFVPIFLAISGRPPSGLQGLAVVMALAGLWILTGGPRKFNRGDALTLLSAAAYAAHLLATDKYVRTQADTLLLAFHQFWMTGLVALFLAWGGGATLHVVSPAAAWTIVFLALVPTLSAFFLQMAAQKRTAPLKVSLIFSTEPVFAALFAWTLGGEPFEASGALGGALIVMAMVTGELGRLPFARARKGGVAPLTHI